MDRVDAPARGRSDPPPITVRLFGGLDIRLGDEQLVPVESARARSLLAQLLLHPGAALSRERLAFTLWPDSTESQARTNLRHLLHTLRRTHPALDAVLDVTPQAVRWRDEPLTWVDATAFDAALARADAPGVSTAEAVRALREAVALCTGDLLEGTYDEWLDEPRDRFRDRYGTALVRVTRLLADSGDHAEAIRLGRELLRTDPLREDSYRFLMEQHAAIGDRAGAVRMYHECASTLQRELGVDPSSETAEAYAALVGSVDDGEPASEPRPVLVAGAALVGREPEWRRLVAVWRDAQVGGARLALVSGEPGVGKTRLVEELAAWCAHRGAVVAQARSYPTEGDLGYGVVVSWLRAPEVAAHLRQVGPADRAELGRLLPELATTADGPWTASADDADHHRQRLFDAVARALIAAGRPILLVADDVQWCDHESLRLIHYMVRSAVSSPVTVVATMRREDLDAAHPLDAFVQGLQAVDRGTEIQLSRLARDDSAELARRLAGRDLDERRLDQLHAETEGNPLFIVEALRGGWDGSSASGSALSPKLQAVIGARLGRLSTPALGLTGLAAAVGRSFTADLLRTAAQVEDDELVRALDELWRRGIVREEGADGYDFSHGKIRDAAYEALSPAVQRAHHRAIADALSGRSDPDAVSGEVARHYECAGAVRDALGWYRRAATQSQRFYANAEAVRLLERARELIDTLPTGDERLQLELEVVSALPTPLAAVGGFASPRLAAAQERVLELAGVVGAEPDPPLLRSLAMTSLCRDDFDGARRYAGRLLDVAERTGDAALHVEGAYLLGIAAFWGGSLDRAREQFELVVRDFAAADRPEHLVRFGQDPGVVCLSRLANTLWFLGHTDEAQQARDEALAVATELGHPFSLGVVHVFAALLDLELGDEGGYRRHVAAMQGDVQDRPLTISMEAFAGHVDVLDGRLDAGLGHLRAALDAEPVSQAPSQRATILRLLVAGFDAAGDAAGGLRAADEALGLGGTRLWEAEVRRLRGTFLAALGAPSSEVDAELARAAGVARAQGALGLLRRVEQTRARRPGAR